MNAINRVSLFPKKRAKQGPAGFSLIELLVVIAIIGVLAAAGIPAFQNYQDRATDGVVGSTLNTISKGAQACIALDGAANCQTLGLINVNCDSNKVTCSFGSAATNNTSICFEVSADSSKFKGCTSISAATGTATTLKGFVGSNQPCASVNLTGACSGTTFSKTNMGCPTGCTFTVGTSSCSTSSYVPGATPATCTGTYSLTASNLPSCSSGVCQ